MFATETGILHIFFVRLKAAFGFSQAEESRLSQPKTFFFTVC